MEAIVLKLPQGFCETVSSAFYDKRIVLYAWIEEKTAGFGTRRVPAAEPCGAVKANWQEVGDTETAREYGLLPGGGAVLTCAALPAALTVGCFARSPQGRLFRVKELLHRDSHCRVLCEMYTP